MENKFIKFILLGIILIVASLALILLVLRGDEDTWLCENGQWIQHGNPDAPKPIKPCI